MKSPDTPPFTLWQHNSLIGYDPLPDKLSDLLELALDDLEKIEKNPRYGITMSAWHEPLPDGICHVCLAGAVMAQTLEVPHNSDITPSLFPDTLSRKLNALDFLRKGEIAYAQMQMGMDVYTQGLDIDVIKYHIDPKGFKQTLRKLVPELREKGL